MKVLVTGAAGQVGRALVKSAPAEMDITSLTRSQLDLTDEQRVAAAIAELRPDVVINAAAYTAVDKAESEFAAAQAINADAVRWLAQAVAKLPATRLLHISTDFVFDGHACVPYAPDARTDPLNVYGKTKLAGEWAVGDLLGERGFVLRTSWVYDATGRNFLNTMLRFFRESKPVRVVADQIGTPTSAGSIASVLWEFAKRDDCGGVWHWSDAGVASWYDFAVAISEESYSRKLIPSAATVAPISTSEYPTLAKRPAFSVLDKRATLDALGASAIHWRQNLRQVIEEMRIA